MSVSYILNDSEVGGEEAMCSVTGGQSLINKNYFVRQQHQRSN